VYRVIAGNFICQCKAGRFGYWQIGLGVTNQPEQEKSSHRHNTAVC
jgi:hypothetical protein